MIDPILGDDVGGGGIALGDRAPSAVRVAVLTFVSDFPLGDLLGGDHSDPRAT